MAYPILAPNSTWFAPNVSTVTRSIITEIEIMDSYTPDSSVTVVDSWDASAAKNGSITCYVIGTKLTMAGNGSGKIAANVDSAYLFSNSASDRFTNITTINGISILDVSQATTLLACFYYCSNLISLDVSSWQASSCTKMSNMFCYLSNITNITLGKIDTSKVEQMGSMFYGCTLLNNLDLSGINTQNVKTMSNMFGSCSALKSVNLANLNTSSLENMNKMFDGCTNLSSLNMRGFNTSKVTTMHSTFKGCASLTTLDLSDFSFETVTCTVLMFKSCSNLQNLILPNSGMSNATEVWSMFSGCNKLSTIDVSGWDVSNITDASSMFSECNALVGLDLSRWNPSSCTNISFMFYSCSSLGEIDVSNWNTSKLTNIDHFAAHANLKRKGMEKWNTSSLTNANAAFHNCAEEELDLSGWDVSKVQFFCQMFENSPNLKRVKGLDKWDTSAGLGFDGMFERCGKLEEVDLSAFDTSKAKNGVSASDNGHKTATLSNMFLSCNSLKKVKIGSKFAINGDGTNTTTANKLILPTPSIEGADGNWYDVSGDAYAPNAIQDRTEETYYASYPLVADLNVVVKNGSLIDTARAIREKNGTTNKYEPSEFGDAIRAI